MYSNQIERLNILILRFILLNDGVTEKDIKHSGLIQLDFLGILG